MSDAPPDEPLEIPWRDLAEPTLTAILEEFVTREGTDYGPEIFDLPAKVAHVRAALARGEAAVTWDPRTETVGVVTRRALRGA